MAITLLVVSFVFDVLVGLAAAYMLVQELRAKPADTEAEADGPPQGPGGERLGELIALSATPQQPRATKAA